MKRVFTTLLAFLPERKHARSVTSPRRHRPFPCWLSLEALEDRVVPSTSVLGVPMPDLVVPLDLSPGPFTTVSVTAQAEPAGPLAQVLGNQPTVELAVPVPDFLTP